MGAAICDTAAQNKYETKSKPRLDNSRMSYEHIQNVVDTIRPKTSYNMTMYQPASNQPTPMQLEIVETS